MNREELNELIKNTDESDYKACCLLFARLGGDGPKGIEVSVLTDVDVDDEMIDLFISTLKRLKKKQGEQTGMAP